MREIVTKFISYSCDHCSVGLSNKDDLLRHEAEHVANAELLKVGQKTLVSEGVGFISEYATVIEKGVGRILGKFLVEIKDGSRFWVSRCGNRWVGTG